MTGIDIGIAMLVAFLCGAFGAAAIFIGKEIEKEEEE